MTITLNTINQKSFLYNNYYTKAIFPQKENTQSINKNIDLRFLDSKRDLVSFGARSLLISENMKIAPSAVLCRNIYINAEPAEKYLELVLNKYLDRFVCKPNNSKTQNRPIAQISTRLKDPVSIREKVVSKYSKLYRDELDKFSNEIYDEFSQYCDVNPSVDRKVVIEKIQHIIKDSLPLGKSSIYENQEYLIRHIYKNLRSKTYFSFSNMSKKRIDRMLDEIISSMEDKKPPETHEKIIEDAPSSVKGIKYYANDIVGARIVLKKVANSSVADILDAIKLAVKEKNLKIISIESNVPDPQKLPKGKQVKDYLYATEAQLRSLANTSNAKFLKNTSKSGYIAIHINVDLSNTKFGTEESPFNGYKGEIQIIGEDVEKLKDVEDLCYKLKDNKNAIKAKYKKFKEHFFKYYTDDIKKDFDEYTYMLYLKQRAARANRYSNTIFPSIKALGFEGKIPPELDFNKLRELKLECDNDPEAKKREQLEKQKINDMFSKSQNAEDIKEIISELVYNLK